MKVQLRPDIIRVCLDRSDVTTLFSRNFVEESTRVGVGDDQRLECLLVSTPHASTVTAAFEEGVFVVRVPATAAQAWRSPAGAGTHSLQACAGGVNLQIQVENGGPRRSRRALDNPPSGSLEPEQASPAAGEIPADPSSDPAKIARTVAEMPDTLVH